MLGAGVEVACFLLVVVFPLLILTIFSPLPIRITTVPPPFQICRMFLSQTAPPVSAVLFFFSFFLFRWCE